MNDNRFASLTGLRAVVTGSSSGIGRAIAREFAEAGADVIVHCRRSVADARSLVDELATMGRRCQLITADIAESSEADRLADEAWDAFGPIDVWVNNAGADLLTGEQARLAYHEKLQYLLQTDVSGTVRLSKSIGRRMQQAGRGVILNIGWDQAASGMEGESGELFAAAKNAIMGFTRSLALSLAPKVRVNCIAPGWIRTAWGESAGEFWQQRVLRETPLARWGTPEDVARLARFLASADADFITGQIINVNGGAVR